MFLKGFTTIIINHFISVAFKPYRPFNRQWLHMPDIDGNAIYPNRQRTPLCHIIVTTK